MTPQEAFSHSSDKTHLSIDGRHDEVKSAIKSWPLGEKFTIKGIERKLKLQHGTASRVLDEITEEDPSFLDPRKKKKAPPSGFNYTRVGYVPVGRILRENEIELNPSDAAEALKEAGFEVTTLQRKKGKPKVRFLLDKETETKATTFLRAYRPLRPRVPSNDPFHVS